MPFAGIMVQCPEKVIRRRVLMNKCGGKSENEIFLWER
jgi:hypothetical protein